LPVVTASVSIILPFMAQTKPDFTSLFGESGPQPAVTFFDPDGPSAPFGWFGGKAYYAEWILGHFPDHRIYVEPFGGAANVLLRKRPSDVEIYNDLDHRLVNFFRVLRNRSQFEELVRLSTLTPYSREEFVDLVEAAEPTDPVEAAWWFFVRCRQAMGGAGMTKLLPCFWATSTRSRRNMAEPVSKYLSAIDRLEDVADRFRSVMIEGLDAAELIRKYDAPDVLFYCDPPYVHETRHPQTAVRYAKEMTDEDHAAVLEALASCQGKVILSGYESELYSRHLAGWRRETIAGKAHMGNSGQQRTEILWIKF
jgi:DNA adenine methylase